MTNEFMTRISNVLTTSSSAQETYDALEAIELETMKLLAPLQEAYYRAKQAKKAYPVVQREYEFKHYAPGDTRVVEVIREEV